MDAFVFPSSFYNLVVLSTKWDPKQWGKKHWEMYSVPVDWSLHLCKDNLHIDDEIGNDALSGQYSGPSAWAVREESEIKRCTEVDSCPHYNLTAHRNKIRWRSLSFTWWCHPLCTLGRCAAHSSSPFKTQVLSFTICHVYLGSAGRNLPVQQDVVSV